MALVVDASVAFKWFVLEPASDQALQLLDLDEVLSAPDLALVEVVNALRSRTRGRENFDQAIADAAVALPRMLECSPMDGPLVQRALAMTIELEHPLHDSVYLALAERETTRLVTADEKFLRKVKASRFADLAVTIGEVL